MKLTKILKKTRVIILLIFILISIALINPQFNEEGVSIRSVEINSNAYFSGLKSPTKEISPTNYERIIEINSEKNSGNLGLIVSNIPDSNLRKGLELQGGTRVLLQPKEKVTESQINDVVSIMDNRLNTYGLS